ncbi:metalloregulator ArsR/SmtB family transcription factor [Actinomycetospora corticicola]|uniref:DNA-binding transcriptional ArsR family regulator n=1 Tax=Actinomycetospora corticicola TaxID=663602 RepID=A0A7Y9DVM7_9PSEU|nr:metalloregulator ArsR/SmtB family transcription factor [Actinomycetospora corticicola]NYD36239.1 DNA-binding transcriptional ArsR family regulator [Actinomycetospora corticicola]
MGHGTDGNTPTLSKDAVDAVARTMHALSTPSRVHLLLRLREEARTVGELVADVGMEQSAVSHQLRVLRHLGLVVGERDGRQIRYRLHDEHVAQLLDEAVFHVEHLTTGRVDP